MPLENLVQILKSADAERYAVPAFNVVNLLEILAVYRAALKQKSPVIIAVTESGCKEFGDGHLPRGAKVVSAIVYEMSRDEDYKHIPVALHLDHGKSLDVARVCVEAGFTSVMIDASEETQIQNENITKDVVDFARQYGRENGRYITVEAELGTVGGKAKDKKGIEYTDVHSVRPFIRYTGIDALAIAWGTAHGVNKNKGGAELKPELINGCYIEANKGDNECFIVSHGSSTVPQDLVDNINRYGGELTDTSGISPDDVQKVISYGITKLNIATDIALAVTSATREHLVLHPKDWDPRKYAKSVRDAVHNVVVYNIQLLGSAGKVK